MQQHINQQFIYMDNQLYQNNYITNKYVPKIKTKSGIQNIKKNPSDSLNIFGAKHPQKKLQHNNLTIVQEKSPQKIQKRVLKSQPQLTTLLKNQQIQDLKLRYCMKANLSICNISTQQDYQNQLDKKKEYQIKKSLESQLQTRIKKHNDKITYNTDKDKTMDNKDTLRTLLSNSILKQDIIRSSNLQSFIKQFYLKKQIRDTIIQKRKDKLQTNKHEHSLLPEIKKIRYSEQSEKTHRKEHLSERIEKLKFKFAQNLAKKKLSRKLQIIQSNLDQPIQKGNQISNF